MRSVTIYISLLIALIFGVLSFSTATDDTAPTQAEQIIDTSARTTYVNGEHGFSFSYPERSSVHLIKEVSLSEFRKAGAPHLRVNCEAPVKPLCFVMIVLPPQLDRGYIPEAPSLDSYASSYRVDRSVPGIADADLTVVHKSEALRTISGVDALKQTYSTGTLDPRGESIDHSDAYSEDKWLRYVLTDGRGRFFIIKSSDPAAEALLDQLANSFTFSK